MLKITFNTPELIDTGEALSECVVIMSQYNIRQDINALSGTATLAMYRTIENAVDRFNPVWVKEIPEILRTIYAPLTATQFANVDLGQVYNALKNILEDGDSAGQWQDDWGDWAGLLAKDALNTVTVEMPTVVDVAPTLLSAATLNDSIVLAWTSTSTNEFGFRIERSEVGSGTDFMVVGQTDYNVTTWSDNGSLEPDTEYFYRVTAWNWSGQTAYTNEASDTTDPIT